MDAIVPAEYNFVRSPYNTVNDSIWRPNAAFDRTPRLRHFVSAVGSPVDFVR
jgi:hypothetical protein